MSFVEEKALEDKYVMHTFGRKPVELVSGEAMYAFDDGGKKYLDFISGIGVLSLGHCHPRLVDAIASQAKRLIHVSNYYYIEGRGALAKQLSDLLTIQGNAKEVPTETWQTFFGNSGAEANECAIKLARLYGRKTTGAAKRQILTLERSFHGRTLATLAATAQPVKQEAFQPLPDGFLATPANDIEALRKVFLEKGESICALLLEPVQGECGVYPCSNEYLETARRLCDQHGALLMFDEVQCGIYRCGTYPYAFQHSTIRPDVVTMAKGLGGGVPIGVCSAKESVAEVFEPGIHGSTFGGSNLAVAAANCVLEVIRQENIAQNVTEVGNYLKEKLQEVPAFKDVRGLGLMVAVDGDDSFDANAIALKGLEAGLLLNATGPHTLRFLPPLICSKDNVDSFLKLLKTLL